MNLIQHVDSSGTSKTAAAPLPEASMTAYSGFLGLGDQRIHVEFEAPAGATKGQVDAAFMRALAQRADIDYLSLEGGAAAAQEHLEAKKAYRGYIILGNQLARAEFEAPATASEAEIHSAFLDAMEQQAQLDYWESSPWKAA